MKEKQTLPARQKIGVFKEPVIQPFTEIPEFLLGLFLLEVQHHLDIFAHLYVGQLIFMSKLLFQPPGFQVQLLLPGHPVFRLLLLADFPHQPHIQHLCPSGIVKETAPAGAHIGLIQGLALGTLPVLQKQVFLGKVPHLGLDLAPGEGPQAH